MNNNFKNSSQKENKTNINQTPIKKKNRNQFKGNAKETHSSHNKTRTENLDKYTNKLDYNSLVEKRLFNEHKKRDKQSIKQSLNCTETKSISVNPKDSQVRLDEFRKNQCVVDENTVKQLKSFKQDKQFGKAKTLIEKTMKNIGNFQNIKVVRYGNTVGAKVGDETICNNIRAFIDFLGEVVNEHVELNIEFERNREELQKAGIKAESLNELIKDFKNKTESLEKEQDKMNKQRLQDLVTYDDGTNEFNKKKMS